MLKLDLFPSDVVGDSALGDAIAKENIANFFRSQTQVVPWWSGELG